MSGEFDFIREKLAPLATVGEALGLTDDVALLHADVGPLITSMDMMVAGRHFRHTDPYDTVAQKLLAANVSDIVAKGAKPVAYMLSCAWAQPVDDAQMDRFVDGLGLAQAKWGLTLLGGDTVTTDGPASFTVTIFGTPFGDGPILRSGAKPGQQVWVSGTLGDAALGLHYPHIDGALDRAYLTPLPPFDAAEVIAKHGTASIDLSDGLLADGAHIADQSGCKLVLNKAALPLSNAARLLLANAPEAWPLIWSGGDDYQTLVCAPPESATHFQQAGFTLIGDVQVGEGVVLLDIDGQEITAGQDGFTHF